MEYKKIQISSNDEFDKEKYIDYDIVYDIKRNFGYGYHLITIFKQPENISDRQLAYLIDGFFWDVIRSGNSLLCYYD